MPRTVRKARPAHSRPDLVDALAIELGRTGVSLSPDTPTVYEEEQRPGGYLHVTVLWDAWKGIPTSERGAIILEAYEKARLKEELRRITLALGVTPEERDRIGLDLQQ